MKNKLSFLAIAATLAIAPAAFAADPATPGKSSDGVREPAANPPASSGTGLGAANTPAREPGKASDGVRNVTAQPNKFHGKITAVDAAAKTVTIEDSKAGTHTMHISGSTKITKGDAASAWSDLKVGEEIHGSCKKDGDKIHAEEVMIGK